MPTQPARSAPDGYVRRARHMPLSLKLIGWVMDIIGFLALALLLSIIVEWLGMFFFWPEQGSLHSQQVLKQELSYLNNEFTVSITGSSPAIVAFDFALLAKYYLFEFTHFIQFWEWLKLVPSDASEMRMDIARTAYQTNEYFNALINTTLIYAVRVCVATLSLPAFILIGLAAMVDGLVHRELRIYGGGIEKARLYHHVKPWIKPAIISTWFYYLSIPFSIHPNLIFGPAVVAFSLAVFLTVTLYKKHL